MQLPSPPCDRNLELELLATVMGGRPASREVLDRMEPTDFHGPCRGVMEACWDLYRQFGAVDPGRLYARLDPDQLRTVEQSLALEPRVASAEARVNEALAYSEARRLQAAAGRVLLQATEFDGDLEAVHDGVTALAAELGSRTAAGEESSVGDAARTWIDTALAGEPARIPSGLPDLDRDLWGGWAPGTLTTLGGRRASGKTAIGLAFADHAMLQGRAVVWVSQEMSAPEVAGRLVVRRARVPRRNRDVGYTDSEVGALRDAGATLRESRLTLWTRPIGTRDLTSLCRRWRAQGRLDLLCVDYVQILRLDRRGGRPEHEAVALAVQDLKAIGQEFSVPVLALAQCRREAPTAGKAPRPEVYMSDFKSSGAIEEHSDHVLLTWPVGASANALDLAKNRHGRTRRFMVTHDWETMRVSGYAPDPAEAEGGER